jgi:AcrR family transcriptional regulator
MYTMAAEKHAKRPAVAPGEPGFHDHIVAVGAKLLASAGYEGFTMRRLAQDAGCSPMALYRHFPNKETLIVHLCRELYVSYAATVKQELDSTDNAWERLQRLIAAVIQFAHTYPDHYSLIFLVRHPDAAVVEEREKLGHEFLSQIQDVVRLVLPQSTPRGVVRMRLQQMLACLHGTAALLIAHPGAYRLTRQTAIRNAKESIRRILTDEPSSS